MSDEGRLTASRSRSSTPRTTSKNSALLKSAAAAWCFPSYFEGYGYPPSKPSPAMCPWSPTIFPPRAKTAAPSPATRRSAISTICADLLIEAVQAPRPKSSADPDVRFLADIDIRAEALEAALRRYRTTASRNRPAQAANSLAPESVPPRSAAAADRTSPSGTRTAFPRVSRNRLGRPYPYGRRRGRRRRHPPSRPDGGRPQTFDREAFSCRPPSRHLRQDPASRSQTSDLGFARGPVKPWPSSSFGIGEIVGGPS